MILQSENITNRINELTNYGFKISNRYTYRIYCNLPGDGNYIFPLNQLPKGNFKNLDNPYFTFEKPIQDWILNYYAPIYSYDTNNKATHILSINFSKLLSLYTTTAQDIIVFDIKNQTYVHGIDKISNQINEKIIELNNKDSKSFETTSTRLSNDKYIVSLYSPTINCKYYFVYGLNYAHANNKMVVMYIVFIVGIFIILFGSMLLIYRLFISKINRIIYKVDKININKQKYEITFDGNDEISRLDKHLYQTQQHIIKLVEENYISKMDNILVHNELLVSQINPHFLYNTLNMVSSIAYFENATQTDKALTKLSNLFKYSIMDGADNTTIENELQHIHNYLSIQQLRFQENFSYDISVDNELLSVKMPKLLIQPIVENFFKHGYCNKKDEKMKLEIIIKKINEGFIINIRDNGKGISSKGLNNIRNRLSDDSYKFSSKHIGLNSVQRRMKIYFSSKSNLNIDSIENKYTHVKMTILFCEN